MFPKIVGDLTSEQIFYRNCSLGAPEDTRLKLNADEVELLLRVLYGYNLICFLKPATPLIFFSTIELRISCFFESHAILNKPKGEASMRQKILCIRQNKTKKNRHYHMVRVERLLLCVPFCLLSS